MLRRNALLILVLFSALELAVNPSKSFVSTVLSSEPNKPLVMVIANSSIYAAIRPSLNQYAVDVENEGFSVSIIETNQLPNKTSNGIKAYLQKALNQDLIGALFIGDIPEAWFKVGDRKLPTDMYYRDLNGYWRDLDGDGIYDEHSGEISPEIWVGRLKASTIACDEASLLKNYFIKNHRYRDASRILPWWRTLAYIDDDGVDWAEEAKMSLSQVSTDITLVTDSAVTNAQDYKEKLKDPFGYEWVYLMCHGSFDYHTFIVHGKQRAGTVFSWEYRSIDPRALFYIFFTCLAARYTEQDYLTGSAVFTDTYGLLAIGATDKMFSTSLRRFFAVLSEGKSIGTAFQEWFLEQHEISSQLQEKLDSQFIFYGLTITGDPTLKPYSRRSVQLHNVSITDVTIHFLNVGKNGGTLSIIVNIENRGNFTESFDLTIHAYSLTLASLNLSLTPKNYTTVNFTVSEPYRVIFAKSLKTMVTVATSIIPEEFNVGDNVEQLCIEGVAITKSKPRLRLNPLACLILIFAMLITIPYCLFKTATEERPLLLRYLMRGKSYLTKKLSDLMSKLRAL